MASLKVFLLLATVATALAASSVSMKHVVDDAAIFVHELDECDGKCDSYSKCAVLRKMHSCFETAGNVDAKKKCIGLNCLKATTPCALKIIDGCHHGCIRPNCEGHDHEHFHDHHHHHH